MTDLTVPFRDFVGFFERARIPYVLMGGMAVAAQQELLKRKVRVHVEGLEAWLVSPEDLILLKLIAGRPRDYGDIVDILFVQGQLDESYLRRWAALLGIADRLEKALRDAKEQTQ